MTRVQRGRFGSKIDPYFLASILCAAVLLLVTLLLPLGFDNDVYESMGWTLYAYHGLPYLASWDMNFPGIVFVHAASIALFGASDLGFRLFDYFAHILLCGLYYQVLRRWLSPRQSFFAVLIYIIYYAGAQWALAGQRDEYAILLILPALVLYLRIEREPMWIAFATGVLSGCAFLIRPTYAVFGLSFFILLLRRPTKWRGGAAFVAGGLLPIAALILLYSSYAGGLQQLYDSTIRFNLDAYSSIGVERAFFTLGRSSIDVAALIGLFFIFRNRSKSRSNNLLLILLVVSAVLSPVLMGKYFTYHQEVWMLIVIGFAAVGLDGVSRLVKQPQIQLAIAIALIVIFAWFYYPRHLVRMYVASLNYPHPIEAVYHNVYSDSLFGLAAKESCVRYVDARVPADSTVEVATFFPSLRWRMHRPMATRFTSLLPLMPLVQPLPEYMERWRSEYVQAIAAKRPAFIVLSSQHEWWRFANEFEDQAPHLIPGFDSLLAASYVHDTTIAGYILYRRRI